MEIIVYLFFIVLIFLVIFLSIAAKIFKIVNQYQIGLVLQFGKIIKVTNPGLNLIIPFLQRLVIIDTRTITLPIQSQKIITKDNVSIDVAGVAYYRIVDAVKMFTQIANADSAVNQIAQTSVREVIGGFSLDEVLTRIDQINSNIKVALDRHTEAWGIQVSIVQLKDIQLPEGLQRAMAKEAEAEREKRAKIIAAEGEYLASKQLAAAAKIMAEEPIALELRTLQTLTTIAEEKNSTIIFPARFLDIAEVLGDLGSAFKKK